MKKITFRYADEMSNWKWRTQHCYMTTVQECIKVYGLGVDCKYEIVSIEDA